MVLINAIYFEGAWTTPFNPERTREMPFRLLEGGTRLVPMMYREGRIDFYENGYQAVRLPYGHERLAMYVFLPPAGVGFRAFVDGLTYDELDDSFARFAPARGEVFLPRIDIAFKALHQRRHLPVRAEGGRGRHQSHRRDGPRREPGTMTLGHAAARRGRPLTAQHYTFTRKKR